VKLRRNEEKKINEKRDKRKNKRNASSDHSIEKEKQTNTD